MSPTVKKILFFSTLTAIAGGGAYLVWSKFFKETSVDDSVNNNFNELKNNLGSSYAPSSTGQIYVEFNNKKNSAVFYQNDRVIIRKKGDANYIRKGTYSYGGMTFIMDGGKTISSGSVFSNLLESIK